MKRTAALVRRVIPPLPAFVAALVALQCIEAPLEPIAPYWNTEFSIPIADVSRTLEDLFTKDTSSVKRDVGGGFYFEDTQVGQPVRIDTLKVSPQPAAEQVSIGQSFEVSAITPPPVTITASSIGMSEGTWPGPPAPGFPGTTTTIPATAVGDTDQFAYAAVVSGSLSLSIVNTLPMTITFNGPIVLQNNLPGIDTTVIATFPFDSIPAGTSDLRQASLAGKFVWGSLRTAPVSVTIGAKTGPFDITPSTGLQLTFGSTALQVDSARAVVPGQNLVSRDSVIVVVDDSVTVTDARFRRGSFSTRFINNLDVQVGVRLQIDNFRSTVTPPNAMSILRTVQPRSVLPFFFSLDTLRLVNPTPDPIGTRVKFSVGIETITSAGQKSTITKNDFVRAEFTPQNSFVLQNITGRIKPTTLAFASGASGLSLGEAADKFAGNFTFDSVRIAVNLGLTGGFPVRYSLALEARNRKSNTVATLKLPPPAGQTDTVFYPAGGAMTTIALGNSQGLNTFLSNFFPNFPDTFIVRGSVIINPGFVPATIADTSKLYQSVNMYFPMRIGLANGRVEEKVDLGSGEKFPKEFAEDIVRTSLRFAVTNGLPAQLGFRVRLLGKPTPTAARDTLLKIPADGSARFILAAPVDALGKTTGSQKSIFEIALTDSEVVQFNKADTLVFRLDLQTTGTGTQPVWFRTTDFIRVRMGGNMVYTVNKPKPN